MTNPRMMLTFLAAISFLAGLYFLQQNNDEGFRNVTKQPNLRANDELTPETKLINFETANALSTAKKSETILDAAAFEKSITFDENGHPIFEPMPGIVLHDEHPLMQHIEQLYNGGDFRDGLSGFSIGFYLPEPEPIYGKHFLTYRVIEDANSDWHLFPFTYGAVHMFSNQELENYLASAPETTLKLEHAYLSSRIDNVVSMYNGQNLSTFCNNNVCIGTFDRPTGANVMWSIDGEAVEELMARALERDPYLVGVGNCDIDGAYPINEHPSDKSDCYIEVRAVREDSD